MQPNDLAFDRFRVELKAGSGGMGTVYRARDERTGDTVALKVLREDDPIDVGRFEREASILATLQHPGIVRYVDHGSGPDGHYLAMEWLEGEDLAARLSREGLDVAGSVALVRRVAEALAVAHARGIVHRDIKPKNLFLVDRSPERVKVLDFGIARLPRTTGLVTMTGAMLGTPGYMAPEQADGSRRIDPLADVFSLGCVLFRCLTGEPAFGGESIFAILAKTALEQAPRVSELRVDVPAPLDELVASMLAKSPPLRPTDGAAVAKAIAALGPIPDLAVAPLGERTSGLTESERRVLSVVLLGRRADGRWNDLASLEDAAAAQGGRLERLADGSMLVQITAVGAATDLAARAARAALAIRALEPAAPMALATGMAVLSTKRGTRPIGALVDRGVGLLVAEPEAVRIDDATAGLLDVRFVVTSDERGLALRAERDVIEARRTLLGKPYACVGRDKEIALLDAQLGECTAESVARAVLVTSPAGRGKSRVRFEFLRRLAERGERVLVLFLARADSVSAKSPFGLLAPALRRAAGILEGEHPSIMRRRLRARVGRHMTSEQADHATEFLAELAGIPPPEEARDDDEDDGPRRDSLMMGDGMLDAWCAFLEAELALSTVMIVLEDLHWGDLPTVRYVDAALRRLARRPLFVLALARPEVHAEFPGLWAERDLQEIRLGVLTAKASERLVREVLGPTATDDTVARIVERSGGNAFYLEELIRAVATGTAKADQLPDTVLGMVHARLDTMGSDAKRVLRAASVFGQAFWRGGVIALLGGEARAPGVGEWLAELVSREIVAAQGEGGLAGQSAYIFRHALLRDAAYAMLTDSDRALGHRLAGEWLEGVGCHDAMLLAQHFERGRVPARAASWLLRAAEQALEGNDFEAAVSRASRAVDAGASGETLGTLRLIGAEAEKWRGKLSEGYRLAVEAADTLTRGSASWFRAVSEALALAAQLGHIEDLEFWTSEASTPHGERAASAQVCALCRAVNGLLQAGRREAADVALDRVQQLAPNLGNLDRATAARVHATWAVRAYMSGHYGAALAEHVNALTAFEAAGDVRGATSTRIYVGVEYAELGDYPRAEAALREALATGHRLGLTMAEGWARGNLGNVLARSGRLDEARPELDTALEMGVAQGNRRLAIAALVIRTRVALEAGDIEGGLRFSQRATDLAADLPPLLATALAAMARAKLARGGSAEEALDLARRASTLLDGLRGAEGAGDVRLVYAQALWAVGDREGAREVIRLAHAELVARGMKIEDGAVRARMLGLVAENAQIVSLAAAWLDAPA